MIWEREKQVNNADEPMSSPIVSRASSPEDYEAIAAYMRNAMGYGPQDVVFERSFCHWKYWQPNPLWPGSRGHLLTQNGRIVAHIAAWPVQLLWEFGTVTALHPIDWAGSRNLRGAGKEVMKSLSPYTTGRADWGGREITKESLGASATMAGAMQIFLWSGTESNQSAVRSLGLQPVNPFRTLIRPLRPFRQALKHRRRDWLLPARYLRDTIWTLFPAPPVPSGWGAREVAPEEIPEYLWPRATHGQAVSARSAEWYRYVLSCPVATVRLYLLLKMGRSVGYFCLIFVPGQARLADYSLVPIERESCAALAAIAQKEALRSEDCCELVAGVTESDMAAALSSAGFRLFVDEPIKVFNIAHELQEVHHLRLTLLDGDSGFLY